MTRNSFVGRFVAMVTLVCVFAVIGMGSAMAQRVNNVVLSGNQRVSVDAVKDYMGFSRGMNFDSIAREDALRNLYASGLFSEVNISVSGGNVRVAVKENPVINTVAFEGNDRIKDEDLAKEASSRAGGVYSAGRAQADATRLIAVYSRIGRYSVKVEPRIIYLERNRVNLVFEITEGVKTKITSISFIGNKSFSDSQLTSQISTTKSNWLSWLKTSDVFDPQRLQYDEQLLRQFYFDEGYADFRVLSSSADYDRENNEFHLNFTVEEGPRYRISDIQIVSYVEGLSEDNLRSALEISRGDYYSAKSIEDSVIAMNDLLAEKGFAFAEVVPNGVRNLENNEMALTFTVEEGARVFVERIDIVGNTTTRDYVIRREFDFAEGDPYNKSLVDRAIRRLRALGFFSDVKVGRRQGSAPDRIVLVVSVVETTTAKIGVNGSFSTKDGFGGGIYLDQKNLIGRGQRMRIEYKATEKVKSYSFTFTEPYFMGYRLAATLDAYDTTRQSSDSAQYSSHTRGGGVRFGLPITDDVYLIVGARGSRQEVNLAEYLRDNVRRNGEASLATRSSVGNYETRALNYSLIYNTLDNNILPNKGIMARLDQEYAGLGGDVQYLQTTAEVSAYYSLMPDWVLLGRVKAGYVTSDNKDGLRFLDSFFLGPEVVRGFAPKGIGARDMNSSSEESLGGTAYYSGTLELRMPFFGVPDDLGLNLAVFADAGSLFNVGEGAKVDGVEIWEDDKLRSSVGVSVLWQSPFGPFRFDYARTINKGEHDVEQAFSFGGLYNF